MSIRLHLAPLFLTTAALAQQPPAPPVPPTNHITLNVTVDGKPGVAIGGLTQSDFVLLDNKRPQPITSFRVLDADDPQEKTEVILVVDAVNLDATMVGSERLQISKFLLANNGKLSFPTTLAILEDKGLQMQEGFSSDGKELAASLASAQIGLRDIRRSNGIYGADDRLGISLGALRQLVIYAAKLPGRKIILFVSPGWPILSGVGIDLTGKQESQIFSDVVSFSDLFRQARTTIYSVNPIGAAEGVERDGYYEEFLSGIDKPSKTAIGDVSLQVLAAHSGGLVYVGNNDLAGILRQAITASSITYELTFDPPPAEHPRQYHHLEIKLDKPGLKARTLDGYYSQP